MEIESNNLTAFGCCFGIYLFFKHFFLFVCFWRFVLFWVSFFVLFFVFPGVGLCVCVCVYMCVCVFFFFFFPKYYEVFKKSTSSFSFKETTIVKIVKYSGYLFTRK